MLDMLIIHIIDIRNIDMKYYNIKHIRFGFPKLPISDSGYTTYRYLGIGVDTDNF